MSHTKAPWHRGGVNKAIIYDKGGWAICNAVTWHSIRSEQEQEANAKLIAAAPELLEALEILLLAMSQEEMRRSAKAVEVCHQAIAKAKGA